MELSQNALTVLHARYLRKDEEGNVIETPDEMIGRVARTVASVESQYGSDPARWEAHFYDMMSKLHFLPNSPALINAGRDMGQLAACFVLPVEDSMESIFGSLKNAALILQSGGGTGFSFSRLRPRSDIVKKTGGIASGPVSFMKIYNTATEVIKQGGARRGANMGMLRVDHPDVIEFIESKHDNEELHNFNISIAVTDAFMQALEKGTAYNLINPRNGLVTGSLKARSVFDSIVESAWNTGDPGLIFIDRINRDNPTPHIGKIESTNPCGEQPLLPFESCILGSVNLSKMVIPPSGQAGPEINWELLNKTVRLGVRFLDNAIDANRYTVPEIENMQKGNRKIGLGIMGWADMLILLGIRYNSADAFSLAGKVMKFIRSNARDESSALARERGPFPNFDGSIYDKEGMSSGTGPIRNATTTTIAPTGTLSIIADCSSGIEPLFAIAYKRLVLESELYEAHPYFIKLSKEMGFYSPELMDRIASSGNLRGIKEVPPAVKKLFLTAHDIAPEDHVKMQAAFQAFTDNAVSKTINLKHSATKKDVEKAFLLAYQKGCKGITVFRYGVKRGTMVKHEESD